MQKSLFTKYFTICLSMLLVCIVVLGAILMAFAARYFEQDKYSLLETSVDEMVDMTEGYYEGNTPYGSKEQLLKSYSVLANAIDARFFLVSADTNKTLLCTDEQPCEHFTYMVSDEIVTTAMEKGVYRELGRLSGIYQGQYYTLGKPVVTSSGVKGVIFASISANSLLFFLGEILKMFLLSAVLVVVIAFVVIYFITARMVRPLRQMVSAVESFSKGDFSVRVPVQDYSEVGRLAMAFNNMASALATQESSGRSFVANVSHELKTPMTTIAGFIDGILDGTIPPEKQQHYLRIVSDEVKRLSRLVRSMLDIARLEAGEMKLSPTTFDINDIVCQSVFTFEQAIDQKHLDIRGLDAGKVMVEADRDLMHQVVYNLLENAVKFVNEGGYIQVSYHTENDETMVSIKNSGQGLTKEELSKVFNRFYKTDKSRSLDKNGVGLGLHIVRSIVNLHGGRIMARSVEGEYVEFMFTVPTAPHSKKSHSRTKESKPARESRQENPQEAEGEPLAAQDASALNKEANQPEGRDMDE